MAALGEAGQRLSLYAADYRQAAHRNVHEADVALVQAGAWSGYGRADGRRRNRPGDVRRGWRSHAILPAAYLCDRLAVRRCADQRCKGFSGTQVNYHDVAYLYAPLRWSVHERLVKGAQFCDREQEESAEKSRLYPLIFTPTLSPTSCTRKNPQKTAFTQKQKKRRFPCDAVKSSN